MTKEDKEEQEHANSVIVVYDEIVSGAEECAGNMEATFKLYSGCDVSVMPLTTWSREQSQQKPPQDCKTVFIVHCETDEFLSTVQGRFKEFYETTFIIVVDSQLQAGRAACAEIKSALKDLKVDDTEEKRRALDRTLERAKERIVTIKNVLNDVDCWVPKVIMFLCPCPVKTGKPRQSPVKIGKPRRNVSVFFDIDHTNDRQISWMDKQRKVLETDMKLTCRYSDGDHLAAEQSEDTGDRSETILDTYRKNSECVVTYIGGLDDLFGIRSFRDTFSQNINAINTRVQMLYEKCIDVETKLVIFMENESSAMINKLDENQNLFMVGTNGAFTYWMGLLSALGKVNVPRKPDDLFHSDVTHEEVGKPRFNTALLSDVTTPTPRPNTRSTTSIINENDAMTARGVAFTAPRHLSLIGVTYQVKPDLTQHWIGQAGKANTPLSCFTFLPCLRPRF